MFMVVGLIQLIAYQYATGAVMAALERGVRAGAVVGAGAAECRAALADSLAEVLGGEIGASLEAGCEAGPDVVRAWGRGTVPAWVEAGPDLSFDLETQARREPDP